MTRYFLASVSGLMLGAAVATQIAGPLLAQEDQSRASVYRQLELFGSIFETVRSQYVEDVSDEELIAAAIQGMLSSLDPHSSYLPPEDAADMREQTSGEFGGIGIQVTLNEGLVEVVAPMDGTPGAAAGMQSGDLISHVDGKSILGLTLDEAVELMRGPVGSEITLTVLRPEAGEPFDVVIVRDTITVPAVRARLEGDAVVLRIATFNEQTTPGIEQGMRDAVAEAGGFDQVSGIVLDLRNNPGGLLTEAVSVADAFLENGEIVSTRGRNPTDSGRVNARTGDISQGKPIVVLINGGSASASEIVAGALQDHRRAILVGTRSFGKGSVQTLLPLPDNAAMRLTTSRYFTPSGRSIQALGVAPDIVVEQPIPAELPAEDNATSSIGPRSEADLRGSLTNETLTDDELSLIEEERAIAEAAATLRAEDYQLAYAVDILKGLNALRTEIGQ